MTTSRKQTIAERVEAAATFKRGHALHSQLQFLKAVGERTKVGDDTLDAIQTLDRTIVSSLGGYDAPIAYSETFTPKNETEKSIHGRIPFMRPSSRVSDDTHTTFERSVSMNSVALTGDAYDKLLAQVEAISDTVFKR